MLQKTDKQKLWLLLYVAANHKVLFYQSEEINKVESSIFGISKYTLA